VPWVLPQPQRRALPVRSAAVGDGSTMSDWFDGAGQGKELDVAEVLDALCVTGITELIQAGALVSMGTTSDGGALGFTVTVDGRWRRDYFRSAEELQGFIAEALPAVHMARGSALAASAAPRERKRRSKTL
jgi:hypothetical protein